MAKLKEEKVLPHRGNPSATDRAEPSRPVGTRKRAECVLTLSRDDRGWYFEWLTRITEQVVHISRLRLQTRALARVEGMAWLAAHAGQYWTREGEAQSVATGEAKRA